MTAGSRVATALLVAAVAVPGGGLARASCVSANLVASGHSYVFTPGCEDSDCGALATSVTDAVVGSFWLLGDGNPAVGAGIDNGGFPALGGWLYTYPGYPSFILTNWAAAVEIDGCVSFGRDPEYCMGLVLSDVSPVGGDGTFALLTGRPDALGYYDLSQPGDILLVPIPRPVITNSIRSPTGGLISVQGPSAADIAAGLYLDPDCLLFSDETPVDAVRGFRVYRLETPAGSGPPTQRAAADWNPLTDVLQLGEEATLQVDCSTEAADQWLAIGLEFDSGFASAYVSGPSTRITCDPSLAQPDELRPPGPTRERSRSRARRSRSGVD